MHPTFYLSLQVAHSPFNSLASPYALVIHGNIYETPTYIYLLRHRYVLIFHTVFTQCTLGEGG
jgi:hypothetical protein